MATVETVTGPIESSELGTTLIHEHLRTRDEAVHMQWPQAKASGGIPEREHPGDGYDAAIEVATAAVELGVKTICDPTAMFLGRDVNFMKITYAPGALCEQRSRRGGAHRWVPR